MMNILIDNTTNGFPTLSDAFTEIRSLSEMVTDSGYLDYLKSISNGGYYFGKSLHLYGLGMIPSYHSFFAVNDLFTKEYGSIANNSVVFGQDIFANQFGFAPGEVFLVNAETGDLEFLARNFGDWLDLLSEDFEYLTGMPLLKSWESVHGSLADGQRLCAKSHSLLGVNIQLKTYMRKHTLSTSFRMQILPVKFMESPMVRKSSLGQLIS